MNIFIGRSRGSKDIQIKIPTDSTIDEDGIKVLAAHLSISMATKSTRRLNKHTVNFLLSYGDSRDKWSLSASIRIPVRFLIYNDKWSKSCAYLKHLAPLPIFWFADLIIFWG